MQLENRVAVITGGARGIGAGIAWALAGEGAKVALVDVDGAAAEATAATIGNGAMSLTADVSEEAAVRDVTEQVVARFGGLDIFVNNAGGGRPDRLATGDGIGNPFTRITQEGGAPVYRAGLQPSAARTLAAACVRTVGDHECLHRAAPQRIASSGPARIRRSNGRRPSSSVRCSTTRLRCQSTSAS